MNPHLNRLTNLFLLLLGMYALCTLIIESFHLIVPSQIWLWLFALCVCLWFSASVPKGILIGMPLCALILYFLWRTAGSDFSAEFRDVFDHIYGAYSGHYSSTAAVYQYSNPVSSHLVSLLLGMFLLSAFTSACLTSAGFRIPLVILPSALVFFLCIAVNGSPSVLPVVSLFLFWCCLFAGGDVYRKDDAAGKSALLMLLPFLTILFVLLFFNRPDHYQYDQHDIDLSLQFDKLGSMLSEWIDQRENSLFQLPVERAEGDEGVEELRSAPAGWDSSSGTLDLTRPYDYSALNRKAFEVSSNQSGSYYLRGRSFGDYTGTSWEPAVEDTRHYALSLTAQALFGSSGTSTQHFQLISEYLYPYLFLPYFSITDSGSDVSVSADDLTGYGGDYYLSPFSYSSLIQSVTENITSRESELQYREFAHNYYTRLPDSTRTELEAFCAEHLFSNTDIHSIADYIRKIGVYDLDVGAYPSSDYALYFLTGSSHGYCIHYATAACALYRSLGIPARICEGYLITSDPNQFVSVTGRDAHAWVEVYLDGVGWIPVEVTAETAESEDMFGSESIDPETIPPQVSPSDEEPSGLEETPAVPDFSSTEAEAETIVPSDAEDSTDANTGTSFSSEGDPMNSSQETSRRHQSSLFIRILLILILILALLGAGLELRYLLIRAWVSRHLRSDDKKQAVIFLYRRAEKILRFSKSQSAVPEIIQKTAEKARFSQHDLEEDEVTACFKAYEILIQEVWTALSRVERIRFKLIYALI